MAMQPPEAFTARDQETMGAAKNYSAWILHTLLGPHLQGRVLEIGSGVGNYSTGLLANPRVESLTCVELDPLCIERAQRDVPAAHPGKRVEFVHGDFHTVGLPKGTFGTVVLVNVLEHLEHDRDALRRILDLLEPAGKLIIYVPAFQSLYGAIDERLGHFRRYSRSTLHSRLKEAGFDITRMRYFNVIGGLGWWFRFRVLKRTEQNAAVVGLYDRVIFPIQAAVEQNTPWQPFGQSLFAVAQRP